MAIVGSAQVYVDRPPPEVLDFLERVWFPQRPVFQNASVDRGSGSASGLIPGSAPSLLSVNVTETGHGSTLEIILLLSSESFVTLFMKKKLNRNATEFAQTMKNELTGS